MATNYERGRTREYKTMNLLEAAGYEPFRMAGSRGTWDVIGVSNEGIVLVQVKLNRAPTEVEYEVMRLAKCPTNGRKLVHIWQDRGRMPQVKEV